MKLCILGGLKHCGKSSLGRVVARNLEFQFFDLDDLILETAAGTWNSVREIWQTLGKNEFFTLEEQALRNFIDWTLPSYQGRGITLSLGGGTIENMGARNLLNNQSLKVYIRADANLLFKRIMAGGRPPFLSEKNPLEDFLLLYQKRDLLYKPFANLIHDVDDSPLQINAQRLLVKLEEYYGR